MSHINRRQLIKGSLASLATAGLTSGLQAKEIANSIRNPKIPKVKESFINIYKPGPDVYPLKTRTTKDGNITYKQGETYPEWRTNDHTFIKDPDSRWHCFGITKPWITGDNGHSGEGLCFHAIGPKGTFAEAATFQSWKDLPKIHLGDCAWAPTAIKIGSEYSLIGSRMGRVTSTDLNSWKDLGRLKIKGGNRDAHVLRLKDTYYLLRCDGNGINLVTSIDFVNWTDPVTIYKPKEKSYQTESPFLVPYQGLYYLFWTLWDQADKTTSGYCPRTYVVCSESPTDFHDAPVIKELTVHAPEIIQDEDGRWFISSADYPHRGVSVAPLVWE